MIENDFFSGADAHLEIITSHIAPLSKSGAKDRIRRAFTTRFLYSEEGLEALAAISRLAVKIHGANIARKKKSELINQVVAVAANADRNGADAAGAVEVLARHLPAHHKHSGTIFSLACTSIAAIQPMHDILTAGLKALSAGRLPAIVMQTASTAYSRQTDVREALEQLARRAAVKKPRKPRR